MKTLIALLLLTSASYAQNIEAQSFVCFNETETKNNITLRETNDEYLIDIFEYQLMEADGKIFTCISVMYPKVYVEDMNACRKWVEDINQDYDGYVGTAICLK